MWFYNLNLPQEFANERVKETVSEVKSCFNINQTSEKMEIKCIKLEVWTARRKSDENTANTVAGLGEGARDPYVGENS